jgi:hypothetical protein
MYVLQIEHEVLNFDAWKKAFESDQIDPKRWEFGNMRFLIEPII